jgi:preprotein translocase subunit Sec61beta
MEEEEIKGIQIDFNKTVKISLFADDIILSLKTQKTLPKNSLTT